MSYFEVFLSSELQAAQMVKSRQISDKKQGRNPVYQDLLAICETLKLSEPRGQDAAGVFSQVLNKVKLCLNTLESTQVTWNNNFSNC